MFSVVWIIGYPCGGPKCHWDINVKSLFPFLLLSFLVSYLHCNAMPPNQLLSPSPLMPQVNYRGFAMSTSLPLQDLSSLITNTSNVIPCFNTNTYFYSSNELQRQLETPIHPKHHISLLHLKAHPESPHLNIYFYSPRNISFFYQSSSVPCLSDVGPIQCHSAVTWNRDRWSVSGFLFTVWQWGGLSSDDYFERYRCEALCGTTWCSAFF